MSNVTTLASGQINRSDTIEIQLVEAGNRPPHVRILWPPHASVTTVAQLSETLAAAMRILANASTELNRRTAQQKECGRDPGSARCWAVLPVAAWLGIVFPFAMPRTKALPRRLLRIKSIRVIFVVAFSLGKYQVAYREVPMPRTKGARSIVGAQRHMLMRDIAAGVMNPDEIAEKYGIGSHAVYDIRHRKKAELQAILDDWSNEFTDLWAVQKHARVADVVHDLDEVNARLAELKEDAEAATETMRKVHPEASPVRVPSREWRALVNLKIKLSDQICREMGQDATTIDRIAGDMNVLTKLSLLGLTPSERVKAEKRYLTGADQESPPADLSGFTYSGARMTVSEVQAKAVADEQRYVESEAQRAFAERYDELLEQHGIVEDLSHLDRWVPAHVEDAVREAEERFAQDYPNAMPVPAAVAEPVAEPVQASEPALEALEPAHLAAEESAEPALELALEPAPELVEEPEPEPEPKPRMASIDDFRGSIVVTPSHREQYEAVSAWG